MPPRRPGTAPRRLPPPGTGPPSSASATWADPTSPSPRLAAAAAVGADPGVAPEDFGQLPPADVVVVTIASTGPGEHGGGGRLLRPDRPAIAAAPPSGAAGGRGPGAGPVLWAGASGGVPGAAATLAVTAAPHGRSPPPGGSGAADG
ncbi:hypothetical protein AB0G77_39325 [Streptomyces hygroscopicus]|uniref:hypothetical protein n=1 Tax=Streptomyces hygroscopicus TaxID=1912 RepID=UPI0033C9C86E